MPGVTGPVFGMLENVQEVTLRHARTELLLEGRQSGWLGGCCDLPEMRRSVVGYTEFGVVGQAGVDGGGHSGQIGLQHGREILTSFGDAEGRAVGGKPALTLGPRQELGSVVREVLGADDVEIAVLQSICQVDEDANFQRTPVDGDLRPAPRLPSRGPEPAPPSTCGSRPPTKNRTCRTTTSAAMPRAPASTLSRTTATSPSQAAGRAAPSSMP